MNSVNKKNELIGEISGSITHQMNEDVSGINNFLEQIEQDLKLGMEDPEDCDLEELRNKVVIIKKMMNSFSKKINGINDFIKNDKSVNINKDDIEKIIQDLKFYHRKNSQKRKININYYNNFNSDFSIKIESNMLIIFISKVIIKISKLKKIEDINISFENKNDFKIKIDTNLTEEFSNVVDLNFIKSLKLFKDFDFKIEDNLICYYIKNEI